MAKTNIHPESGKLTVVLVRGLPGIEKSIKDTLAMLLLTKKNRCAIVNNNPSIKGMLIKAKDFITWGEITDATYDELVQKRGNPHLARLTDRNENYKYKVIEHKGKKYLPYFNLNPPRKGFGRKGIKVAFSAGGALGYRGEKMDDLIKRML